jgi:hypothetical protein
MESFDHEIVASRTDRTSWRSPKDWGIVANAMG